METKFYKLFFLVTALTANSLAADLFGSGFKSLRAGSLFRNNSATEICYGELGCFSTKSPWTSVLRPLPNPESPGKVNTSLFAYTRECNATSSVKLWPKISIEKSCFNASKTKTVFITHGFSSSGFKDWVVDMKKAYLKKKDVNVVVVDWEHGSNSVNYLQVASNTRIVGAEISRFLNFLIDNNFVAREQLHLIGHSLGAHISGYVAKNLTYVDHITALDPAQPAFEKTPESVRLDKKDALYLDVLHTNTQPFVPLLGFGYIEALGHSDFYLNGGLSQPGCKTPSLRDLNIEESIGSLSDIGKIPLKALSGLVSCSHGRSYIYYTESLENDYCKFWGKKVGFFRNVINMVSKGIVEEWWQKIKKCTPENCSPIGLESRNSPLRGMFEVVTRDSSPYCINNLKS